MNKYITALKGITYPEWVKIKIAVDRVFEKEKCELEKELKLSKIEDVEAVIRSQFGYIQGLFAKICYGREVYTDDKRKGIALQTINIVVRAISKCYNR